MTVTPCHGFATLVPAFTLRLKLSQPISSTPSSRHPAGLTLVSGSCGTLKSEPGFHTHLDAHSLNAVDIARRDNPNSSTLRLNVRSFFKDTRTNETFGCFFIGTIELDEHSKLILEWSPEAKTTQFGKVVTLMTFAAGGCLEVLEKESWVGSGRFVVENGDKWIEYKISQVKGGK